MTFYQWPSKWVIRTFQYPLTQVTSLYAEELGVALGLPQTEKASSASCASASTTDDRDSPQGNRIIIIHHTYFFFTVVFPYYNSKFQKILFDLFTSNEIQPDIILYWRIEFWCKWVCYPFSPINRPKLIIINQFRLFSFILR